MRIELASHLHILIRASTRRFVGSRTGVRPPRTETTMPEKPRTWTLNFENGMFFPMADGTNRDDRIKAYEAGPVDTERKRMLDLLQEIAESGVVSDDDRIGYLDVQIDRETWEQLLALLHEHSRLPVERSS
jgi:hypothetical protein